jgi:imidazolonepropionase-like amidohydrolase
MPRSLLMPNRRPALVFLLSVSLGLHGCGDGVPGPEGPPDGGDSFGEVAVTGPVQAFVNARVFDGLGGEGLADGVVLVRNGVIIGVGERGELEAPEDAEVVDLGGRFLLPGFINAHGHVGSDGERSDVREQLDIYAYYGITTVLSLGDEADDPRPERWSPELRRARLFVAGPSLVPPSPEAAADEVARVAEMGADWVKMHVNAARGRDSYREVIAAARERGMPVAIHIEELEDAKNVLGAGANLLAHSIRDLPVDDELIEGMRERSVCLVPTFTRELSTFVYAERPGFFDDPFFLIRAAPDDLEGFLTPQRRAQAESDGSRFWREALPLAMENALRLHEAGVGIAMGTDSGPSGRFQGYFEHLEMEMMVDAGMEPEAVLISATGGAARCIGLEGILGTIEPGVWADFVVLDEDPREDIRNTRAIHGVWTAGNRIR